MDKALIYAQLARVVQADAEALMHAYAWPPVQATPAESEEADRLFKLGDRLHKESLRMGYAGGWPF